MARSLSLVSSLSAAVALVSISVSVFGCGAGNSGSGPGIVFDACAPLSLQLDDGDTPDQAQAIGAALDLWNSRAGTQLSIANTSASANGSPGMVPLHFQSAAAPFHGLYDPTTGQVFINDDLVDHPRVVTIAHEVGHVMGLVHISPDQRASVMNPGNLVVEPTADDVGALAALWGACR
jgi:hypothetical protein